jgi:hypothetical protein
MVAADRGKPRQGKRQGQAAMRPDPPSSKKYHACKEDGAKEKAPAIKDQPAAGRCVIDPIDCNAKPDQYGRRLRGLRRGSARTYRRQAFLRPAAVAYQAVWNADLRSPQQQILIPTAVGSLCASRLHREAAF